MSTSTSIPVTMKAAQIQSQGGLDQIEVRENQPVPVPKDDEVLIRVEYAGVNFIDTYFRKGVYPIQKYPYTLGQEPAGTIVKLPSSASVFSQEEYKIRGFTEGAKVVASGQAAYAEYVSVHWSKVFKLPDGVTTKQGASSTLQGLTALTFVKEAYEVKKGDWVLIHAAAGGVGLLLCQLCNHFGANVIGVTSSPIKAEIAKANGAHHVIISSHGSATDANQPSTFVDTVLSLTNGEGVEAIFDGVGKDTWENNFLIAKRKGTIVSLGNASGVVPPFSVLKLGAKNLKVVRPVVGNYIATPTEFQTYSSDLFSLIQAGTLKVAVHAVYPFTTDGIRQTQEDLEGRGTSGKLVVEVLKSE